MNRQLCPKWVEMGHFNIRLIGLSPTTFCRASHGDVNACHEQTARCPPATEVFLDSSSAVDIDCLQCDAVKTGFVNISEEDAELTTSTFSARSSRFCRFRRVRTGSLLLCWFYDPDSVTSGALVDCTEKHHSRLWQSSSLCQGQIVLPYKGIVLELGLRRWWHESMLLL